MIKVQVDDRTGKPEAAYFKLRDNKVANTIKLAEGVYLDLDRKKRVVGVEMLNPGQVHIKESIRRKYHLPRLDKLTIPNIPQAILN